MLVTGGNIPTENREYDTFSVNYDSGAFANGLGIFDLNSHQWVTNWDADNDEKYTISSDISKVIGGGKKGSATLKEPESGFNSTKLQTLFNNTHTLSSTSSTPSASATGESNGNSITKGGIAGATVGAVTGAAAIGGLVFFLIVYRRRQNAKNNPPVGDDIAMPGQSGYAELHGQARPVELTEDFRSAVEMPTNNTQNNGAAFRHELEGDGVAEMEGSSTRT